jgi:hypothetical protein
MGAITSKVSVTTETVIEKVTEVIQEAAEIVEEKLGTVPSTPIKEIPAESPITPAAFEAAPVLTNTPTLNDNGEIKLSEPTPETIAAAEANVEEKIDDVVSVVVEETKSAIVTIGNVFEKNEVKTETEPISEIKSVVSEQIENIGDSTPPPLPTIPPPSQVMVFAESTMSPQETETVPATTTPISTSEPTPQIEIEKQISEQIVAAVVDQVPVESPKVEATPEVPIEEVQIPIVVAELFSTVVEDGVPEVVAAPVPEETKEEIRETATEVVEQILEQAVDKVEEVVEKNQPEEVAPAVVEEVKAEEIIEKTPVVAEELPLPPPPADPVADETPCTTEISAEVAAIPLPEQTSEDSSSLPPTQSQSDVSLPSPPPPTADEIAPPPQEVVEFIELPAPVAEAIAEIPGQAQAIVDETIIAATNKLEQLQLQNGQNGHTNGDDASVVEEKKVNSN